MSFTAQIKRWKRRWDLTTGADKRKARRKIKKLKREREKYWNLWGGARRVINEDVVPVASKFGVTVTSRKRSRFHILSIRNPGSDHNKANKTSDAVDLGTFSGVNLAFAIATALGIENYSTGNFNSYFITRYGKTYRVQILWGVEGHWDHVHVGLRLA